MNAIRFRHRVTRCLFGETKFGRDMHPISIEGRCVSATYLPPLCDPPNAGVDARIRIVVDQEALPLACISSPRNAAPLTRAPHDRVVVWLDPALVGLAAGRIGVQETCDPYLYSVLHSLRCGFRQGNAPPEQYLDILGKPLGAHLRENYPVRMRKRERQGLSPERLARVLSVIEERAATGIAVGELAECVHLSPFHFTRMFHRSMGLAPHQYITMRRLERAKLLVATTNQLMGDIARAVGYRNQAHFTRVFHAATGVTPRRMRAQAREYAVHPSPA